MKTHPHATLAEKLRRGDLFAPGCPSREVMKHVTSSWGVLILIALRDGTLRFSELRQRVNGVSERMLSQTLKWLEGDGLVLRRAYPVVPPHTEYSLTPLGEEAAERVANLAEWIEERLPAMLATAEQDRIEA
ncbi:winged helix-turn-helix transcriptional regulator [Methylobacterium brachythecii]|uniref:Transcriptional regulator n=1 Tax=Methylobacterium brachythecii TaxID=1176177 RepID=A0A7W6F5W0_9HYPH|nr:helix-turn-helix domain-containing protein [Methylobacterium brachythecii]MBB3901760.1 DNA-binding HxlR family transcriptional regulator [Methylobacterium brachythecii]GLS43883.1 transcriptional regulator [Methylobacterium brachythecii]